MRTSGFAYNNILDQYLCAHWWRVSPAEWDAMTTEEQETCLAVWRCEGQMSGIRNDPRYADKSENSGYRGKRGRR